MASSLSADADINCEGHLKTKVKANLDHQIETVARVEGENGNGVIHDEHNFSEDSLNCGTYETHTGISNKSASNGETNGDHGVMRKDISDFIKQEATECLEGKELGFSVDESLEETPTVTTDHFHATSDTATTIECFHDDISEKKMFLDGGQKVECDDTEKFCFESGHEFTNNGEFEEVSAKMDPYVELMTSMVTHKVISTFLAEPTLVDQLEITTCEMSGAAELNVDLNANGHLDNNNGQINAFLKNNNEPLEEIYSDSKTSVYEDKEETGQCTNNDDSVGMLPEEDLAYSAEYQSISKWDDVTNNVINKSEAVKNDVDNNVDAEGLIKATIHSINQEQVSAAKVTDGRIGQGSNFDEECETNIEATAKDIGSQCATSIENWKSWKAGLSHERLTTDIREAVMGMVSSECVDKVIEHLGTDLLVRVSPKLGDKLNSIKKLSSDKDQLPTRVWDSIELNRNLEDVKDFKLEIKEAVRQMVSTDSVLICFGNVEDEHNAHLERPAQEFELENAIRRMVSDHIVDIALLAAERQFFSDNPAQQAQSSISSSHMLSEEATIQDVVKVQALGNTEALSVAPIELTDKVSANSHIRSNNVGEDEGHSQKQNFVEFQGSEMNSVDREAALEVKNVAKREENDGEGRDSILSTNQVTSGISGAISEMVPRNIGEVALKAAGTQFLEVKTKVNASDVSEAVKNDVKMEEKDGEGNDSILSTNQLTSGISGAISEMVPRNIEEVALKAAGTHFLEVKTKVNASDVSEAIKNDVKIEEKDGEGNDSILNTNLLTSYVSIAISEMVPSNIDEVALKAARTQVPKVLISNVSDINEDDTLKVKLQPQKCGDPPKSEKELAEIPIHVHTTAEATDHSRKDVKKSMTEDDAKSVFKREEVNSSSVESSSVCSTKCTDSSKINTKTEIQSYETSKKVTEVSNTTEEMTEEELQKRFPELLEAAALRPLITDSKVVKISHDSENDVKKNTHLISSEKDEKVSSSTLTRNSLDANKKSTITISSSSTIQKMTSASTTKVSVSKVSQTGEVVTTSSGDKNQVCSNKNLDDGLAPIVPPTPPARKARITNRKGSDNVSELNLEGLEAGMTSTPLQTETLPILEKKLTTDSNIANGGQNQTNKKKNIFQYLFGCLVCSEPDTKTNPQMSVACTESNESSNPLSTIQITKDQHESSSSSP